MPRDSSGNYTLPSGINPVVADTLIDVNWANPTLNDIANQLNNVLTRDGLLGPVSAFRIQDGSVAIPGLSFASQTGTGLWRNATQAGFSYQANTIFTVDNTGVALASTKVLAAPEVDISGTLEMRSDSAGSIVWRKADGTLRGFIQNLLASSTTVIEGDSQVTLQTNALGLNLTGSAFSPQTTGSVNLGSSALPFGTAHANAYYGLGGTPLIKFLGGWSGTTDFDTGIAVPAPSGIPMGLLMIGGANDPSGVSWSKVYLVVLRIVGGAPPDIANQLVVSVGSASPVVLMSISSGTLHIQVTGNGTAGTYAYWLGVF